mmetsp:Transcript_22829/g.73406  ORF Transcript_22829/g.73406 Transcript_22829/m.73406 type:complete len:275 (+) Transcript_22829:126-950(+)
MNMYVHNNTRFFFPRPGPARPAGSAPAFAPLYLFPSSSVCRSLARGEGSDTDDSEEGGKGDDEDEVVVLITLRGGRRSGRTLGAAAAGGRKRGGDLEGTAALARVGDGVREAEVVGEDDFVALVIVVGEVEPRLGFVFSVVVVVHEGGPPQEAGGDGGVEVVEVVVGGLDAVEVARGLVDDLVDVVALEELGVVVEGPRVVGRRAFVFVPLRGGALVVSLPPLCVGASSDVGGGHESRPALVVFAAAAHGRIDDVHDVDDAAESSSLALVVVVV